MTEIYTYYDLSVNGVTPTSVKAVHNGVTTEIKRLIVNGTDIIHKWKRYSGVVSSNIILETNIIYQYFGGCQPSYTYKGTIKIKKGAVSFNGDITSIDNIKLIILGKTGDKLIIGYDGHTTALNAGTDVSNYSLSIDTSSTGDVLDQGKVRFSFSQTGQIQLVGNVLALYGDITYSDGTTETNVALNSVLDSYDEIVLNPIQTRNNNLSITATHEVKEY